MILNNLIKKYTFKKAQQLVEFAFVAPILILFLLLIMELGYVITIRNVLSEGAKESLMQVNSKFNNLTGTAAAKKLAMEAELKNSMEDFLETHNITNASNVTVSVTTDANGVTFANFTYMYKMILTFIPNLPTIPVQTSQIINTQMLEVNTFDSGLTTAQLSAFFPVGTETGALKADIAFNANDSLRQHIAILVNWYQNPTVTNIGVDKFARLFSWNGTDLLPANMKINLRTATLYVRSPYYNGGAWLNTQIPYVWVVSALGYTQVFYTKFNTTVDAAVGGLTTSGWTLNECSTNDHYDANISNNALEPGYDCPLRWANHAYHYLYRVNPKDYDENDHDKFSRSLGYRTCSTAGVPAGLPDCSADQSGSHSIQELALKGITREGAYCTSCGINHSYARRGNYELMRDTNAGGVNIDSFQHYTVRSSNYNNYDGNYVINIFQPIVNNPAGNYYTAGVDNVDPMKMVLNLPDGSTTDADGNDTPFFTAFKWNFNINAAGIYNAAGAANTDIVDVYMDTDGDNIPDAWDRNPGTGIDYSTYFDANGNAILDGLEQAVGWNGTPDVEIDKFAASADYAFPLPGINQGAWGSIQATPWDWNGNFRNSKKSNPLLPYYIPEITYSFFKVYNPGGGNKLYIQCDGDLLGLADDLCRQYPTWGFTGTVAAPSTGVELTDKERFIYGTVNGAVIDLNQSAELIYLNNNNFSAANRVTRTPAGW